MKSHKFLLFPERIDDTLVTKGASPDSSIKTGYYFLSKPNSGMMSVKTHITNPAMNLIKEWCIDRYGHEKTRVILTELFILLDHLKSKRTALFSLYFPLPMLAYKVREFINNSLTKKENGQINTTNSER